jgi:hypothetical protein
MHMRIHASLLFSSFTAGCCTLVQHPRIHLRVCACMYVYVCVCTYNVERSDRLKTLKTPYTNISIHTHTSVYVYIYTHRDDRILPQCLIKYFFWCRHVCMHVCGCCIPYTNISIHMCVCVYIYIYTHTYTHTHKDDRNLPQCLIK